MKYILYTALFVSTFFAAACNQDPIFMMISNEVEPKDPLISGSPSKFAKINDDIYVANGKLWKYTTSGGWAQAGGPSNVYDIAAAGTTLYLLSVGQNGCTVYKRDSSGEFASIPNNSGFGMIQGVYTGGTNLYAGGMEGESYAILYIDSNELKSKSPISSPLTGVAGGYYATAHNGIYKISDNTLVAGAGYTIAGIIEAEGKIIAVSSGGTIFDIDPTTNSVTPYETSYNFTGALAVYEPASGSEDLLLIGIKGSIYSLGYREAWLNGTDNFALRSPGGSIADSTIPIADQDKYSATLEKYAVNSLIQAGEKSEGWPVIFASTQKNGLWSYRNREWNAEE
ncbi:MAG: hypothetical protein LBD86_00345 [Spirochaetaceae bacterium]|jgi:hypothetical protein|nr:hypothetical protein [Spirochaetaceae bacterium]